MSSSQPFLSSPLATTPSRRRKSQFTFKQLHQLSLSSTATPLRVIAHIDLDAFYAQCEQIRLNLPDTTPVAVQQWQALIAINYPARKFGLSRHITASEAKKLCPELVCQHVATWKEGDEKWAYHEDAYKHIGTYKVSLDPYRMESKKILACIKETLPEKLQRVEKASVDEVFLDLSAQIHSILLERYPQLQGPPPYDDPTENLPTPPSSALDWSADSLVDLDEKETEDDDPDWDDVAMLIGSEIVREVRAAVREKLKYTCSAGIARNKMLSKLGSGHNKPNGQTVVRNRAIQQFLSSFKFTKIRNLGGKLGDEVVAGFNTDTVKELLDVPQDQLQKRLGDDTGSWLYQTIRGEDHSEVNPRTQIKSMLSAKSFRPSINTFEQGVRWLRIFVADIFSRCVEEGVLENKRRPKTINLHHRQGGQTRSKQSPIPQGKTLTEELLFDLAKNLLAQVVVDGRAWPCANLSLSVGGFEDGVTGNKGIGTFLVRGEEAKAMLQNERDRTPILEDSGPSAKRRKVDDTKSATGRIQNFFIGRDESTGSAGDSELEERLPGVEDEQSLPNVTLEREELDEPPPSNQNGPPSHLHQQSIDHYFCSRCNVHLPESERAEHEDWHFAKDLQDEERSAGRSETATNAAKPPPQKPAAGRGRPPGTTAKKTEKGQRKLAFGPQ
ncbi:DNA/RNA polymerase [Rhizodiscina lignyota]|uniref:DNA polymerase eta n=1 Tax=Rhizodiscina lignyota TaxID=1504668 RepID=A0A9P4IRS6_9PEZI|nr:DNA/RNA polymerase [Rhizodiscina lignyota]